LHTWFSSGHCDFERNGCCIEQEDRATDPILGILIGRNTNAPTIMIGEKAADMIKSEIRAQKTSPILRKS
jgi:hypothetical protein